MLDSGKNSKKNKMKKNILKFWSIIFIFTIWAIFSSPYFFQNRVPFPSKYQVTFFAPWSHYQEFAGPVKNNAMPDIITQIYPWKHVTIESLKNGQLPYWNPYNFAGNPHIANFQSAVFSPFNLLFFILPFIDAWSLNILLQPLLAALFTYLYMREVRVSKVGALISSTAFMFCGFMTTWMAYGTLSMAIAFLPLVLFAIEKSFGKKNVWFLVLLSISLAISFFSGHVQTSLYLAIVSAFYLVFKYIESRDIKKSLIVAVFFALGIGISLIQVVPTLALYNESVRSTIIAKGGEIPLNYLVTVFAPDFYGNPVTRNDWIGSYAEWASFIGIAPLLLAFFAFFAKKKSYTYFFAIVGVLALLFSSDTPLRQLLSMSNIPVLATSIPSRMIVIFSICFAILSGFGFDSLQQLIKDKSRKQILAVFGVLGLLLFIVWALLLILHILPADKASLAKKNLILPTLIFFVSGFVVFASSFFKNKRIIFAAGIVLLILTAFDSLRFATKWIPFDQRSLVYPDAAVIKEIKKTIGNGRVFGNLGTEVTSYYGIQSIEGYDPLYIGRYGDFAHSSFAGNFEEAERSVAQLSDRSKYNERVLDLLGVSIIFHPKADTFTTWAFPVWDDKEKYIKFYEDDKFELYKNTTALSRAKLFYSYEVITGKKNIVKKFYSDSFDFRDTLILEEEPDISEVLEQNAKGSAEISSYSPNKVIVVVKTDKPALLFLSDNYYPNWKAKVNGKETKIYRADYTFRAIVVPSGESKVEFYYKGLF